MPFVATSPERSRAEFELWTESDRCLDYCLLPYESQAPVEDAIRSVNLLYGSFAAQGVEAEGRRVVDLVRRGLGPNRTVWGVKHHVLRQALSWEFYFYDHERQHADLTIERLRRLLAPAIDLNAEEPRPLKWLMFSIEFTAEDLRERRQVSAHVYLERTGLSYELRGRDLFFESVYRFLQPRPQIEQILELLERSVHSDRAPTRLAQLLPPELLIGAFHVCVATKREADALYFSRVDGRALDYFLARFEWPKAIRDFVSQHRKDFAHLLWDVGFDFRMEGGRIQTVKSGLYGTF